MGSDNASAWEGSLTSTYEEFTPQFITFAPQLVGAIALLIAGWIVAHMLRVFTRKLVRGFDTFFQNAVVTDDARQLKMKRSYAVILGNLVFWMVIIFFIAATAHLLGWNMISNWMGDIGIYIPNLITGLVIILAGFLFGNVMGKGVVSAVISARMDHAEELVGCREGYNTGRKAI